MAESQIQQWIDNGDRNSEYIAFDEEYDASLPANTFALSVSGLFTFLLPATGAGPIAVSLPPGRYGTSAALAEFVSITNRAKASTVAAALDAATKAYAKIADARDAEVEAGEEGDDATDVDDDAAGDEYFAVDSSAAANADPAEAARREANRRMRELRDQFLPTSSASLPPGTIERLLKDLSQVQATKHHGWTATPSGGNLALWEVKLFGFDKGTPLQQDMARLAALTGEEEVTMHMKFPAAYPNKPPFIRVVRPRFMMRTGRVTVGGSICTELLVQEGWQPVYDIESIIESLRQQITDPEAGARVDLSTTAPYTEEEAVAAFNRVARDHGWSIM